MTSLEEYCSPTRPDAVIFRGAGAAHSRFHPFLNPTSIFKPPYTPDTRPRPFKGPMACPFDQASDRHPTPPLSPSMSSGSSRESSAPSFSTSSSSHLPRDIDGLHSSYPDSQPLGRSDPVIELGRMPDGLGDDTLMLDEWEGEGKREERDDGKHIPEIIFFSLFFFPFLAVSVCDVRSETWLRKDVCNDGLGELGRMRRRKICM